MRKSFTIIELIVSILLMSAIILAAMSFHLASDQFLISSTKKGSVLNDLTFLLEHIRKNVTSGIGDIIDPVDGGQKSLEVDSTVSDQITLIIRQDMANDGTLNNTPQDYTDDRRVDYIFNYEDNTITFVIDPEGDDISEVLLTNLVNLEDDEALTIEVIDTGVKINNLYLQLDPTEEHDFRNNPQVSIDEQIFFSPGQSAS